MKQLKKWLGLALCLAMLVTLLPRLSLTAHAETVSGTCGDNLTWTLDTSTGKLTISGSGKMTNWEYYYDVPWYSYRDYIESVVISSGVTSISDEAFFACTSLTSVTIPSSVTSIGNLAFDWCTSLTSVTIPNSVTSIGKGAFSSCSSLVGILVSAGNQYYSNDASGVLFNKDKTTLLQCPGGIQGAYQIPNSVTSIGYGAFEGCASLTSVTIPSSVTSLGDWAFCDCTSLTSVTIPSSVTSIGKGAFDDCDSLTSVTIPNSVTSIGDWAFYYCTSLTSVTIPNSVTSIGDYAFEYCDSLTSVTIPNSVTSIGDWAFYNCISLTSVTIPNSVTIIGDCAFGYYFDYNTVETVKVEGFMIYGYAGTAAQTYAKDNSITFKALDPATGFADAKPGKYYYNAVLWAINHDPQITKGTDAVHFSPNQTCNRAQVVSFLWNALNKPAPDESDNPFVDVKPSKYFFKPVLWAFQNGVTKGVDDTHFNPNGSCTRAQVVSFIWNALGKPEPTSTDNPFVDVKESKYYYKAVLWAVENGVTKGVDTTHFGPNQTCTRGQVVTFLYNALGK